MEINGLAHSSSLVASTTLVASERSSLRDRSAHDNEKSLPSAWADYPFSLDTFNPFTEWGKHYVNVFTKDLWPTTSRFDLHDLTGDVVTERRIEGAKAVDRILKEDPDIRIFYCDSKLCDDLVTRGSFAVDDLKKIFSHYDFSVVFVDRFIGRNRCVTGARKTYHPDDPSQMTAYDVWYDLPCRIYGSEHEYSFHFTLFTVYAHFDVLRQKTVLFYIHRLGSDQPSAAEKSSKKLKDRIKAALHHATSYPDHLRALLACPFVIQLPTITSVITFWTETLHQERLDMWAKEDEGRKKLSSVDTIKLHDILRYTHSYYANLEIAKASIEFVQAQHEWFGLHLDKQKVYNNSGWQNTTADALQAQVFQCGVIIVWTKEVLKRTQILINLYFNKMSQIDTRMTGRIAVDTKNDAVSMRTIAIITMFFLPATAVASIFDLSFFSEGIFKEVRYVWIYFTVSIGLTTCVITAWRVWLTRRQSDARSEASDFLDPGDPRSL